MRQISFNENDDLQSRKKVHMTSYAGGMFFLPIIQDIISKNDTRSVVRNLLLWCKFFLSPVSLQQNPPAELSGPCERRGYV